MNFILSFYLVLTDFCFHSQLCYRLKIQLRWKQGQLLPAGELVIQNMLTTGRILPVNTVLLENRTGRQGRQWRRKLHQTLCLCLKKEILSSGPTLVYHQLECLQHGPQWRLVFRTSKQIWVPRSSFLCAKIQDLFQIPMSLHLNLLMTYSKG